MSRTLTSAHRPSNERARDVPTTATRWLLGGVAAAAGIIGLAMVLAPGATGTYFSWPLNPPPLAGFVGGCYLASAAIFGWAASRERWAGQRGVCVAVLGLAAPTLVATARHRDVFDFGRWQAVAWVVLFAASVSSFGTLLVRRPVEPAHGPRLSQLSRIALVLLAAAYAVTAVVLWVRGPMGPRFVGSWAAFLSIAAGHAATHPRWEEARLGIIATLGFPIAAAIGAAAA